jgi:hypothetical protein
MFLAALRMQFVTNRIQRKEGRSMDKAPRLVAPRDEWHSRVNRGMPHLRRMLALARTDLRLGPRFSVRCPRSILILEF